jgi:hypothetical protein
MNKVLVINPGIADNFNFLQSERLKELRLMRVRISVFWTMTNWLKICLGLSTIFVLFLFSSCKSIGPKVVTEIPYRLQQGR